MIVEQRVYTAAPGRAHEWLAHYEKTGLAVQLKHLGKLIGFFTTEIGTLNRIVHLWAFDSLAHRESARGAMMNDPDFHAFLKGIPPGCIVSQESTILNPTSFSPLK